MQIPENYLLAAIIGRAHGLRGEVIIDVRTDRPEHALAPGCQLATETGTLTVTRAREYKGRLYLTFQEITTREAAEAARGLKLYVEPAAEENAWYENDLLGLTAQTPSGQKIGTITRLETGTAQDLLAVKLDDGGREVLIPFVEAIVPSIDLENGTITIDAPPGLLE